MYDVIEQIISHAWVSNYSNEQQYIYYICGALIIVLTVKFIDLIEKLFSHFWRG